MIYLDNGATTQVRGEVIQAMLPYFSEYYGNPSSTHSAGIKVNEIVHTCRQNLSHLLGCLEEEVYFTSGGTEADNWAIMCALKEGHSQGRTHVVTTAFEHHAVLNPLRARSDIGVTYVYPDKNGIIHPEDIEGAIKPNTCLVSVMMANNEIGTIQPIKEIGQICTSKGVLFHTDAVQAVGHLKVNFKKLGVDFLSLSGHKFNGPKGIGALIAKKISPVSSFIYGGSQERGLRAGTENVPAIVGMTRALELAQEGLGDKKLAEQRDWMIGELLKISGSRLNGHPSKRLPGNINVSFSGVKGEALVFYLSNAGICVSSGSACMSGDLEPSHVLRAIGASESEGYEGLRITLPYCGLEPDTASYVVKKVGEIVEELRRQP